MSTRKAIIPTGMEAVYDKIHYAPGVLVGNTLYVSGQIGRDENMQLVEGTEAQIVQAFENLKKVLVWVPNSTVPVGEMTVIQLLGSLKPDQLKVALGTLVAALAGAFALGGKLFP